MFKIGTTVQYYDDSYYGSGEDFKKNETFIVYDCFRHPYKNGWLIRIKSKRRNTYMEVDAKYFRSSIVTSHMPRWF